MASESPEIYSLSSCIKIHSKKDEFQSQSLPKPFPKRLTSVQYDERPGSHCPSGPLQVETPTRARSLRGTHPSFNTREILEYVRDQFPRPLYNSDPFRVPCYSPILSQPPLEEYRYKKKVKFAEAEAEEVVSHSPRLGAIFSSNMGENTIDSENFNGQGEQIPQEECEIEEKDKDKERDYSDFIGTGSGDLSVQNVMLVGRCPPRKARAKSNVPGIELRNSIKSNAPDLGIKCGQVLDCGWTGECCGAENNCSCNKCRKCLSKKPVEQDCGRMPSDCPQFPGDGTNREGRRCCKRPYDCVAPYIRRHLPEDALCCLCNACKRAEWHCRNLKRADCVAKCSREMRECYWENIEAKQREFRCRPTWPRVDRCGVPRIGGTWHKRMFRDCGCACSNGPNSISCKCQPNCPPPPDCPDCPIDHKCPTPYNPCIRRAFTCHGHGPLCSCSWLDKGETFRSQLKRCICKGKCKCKCPPGFGEGQLKGPVCPPQVQRKRFLCSNAGCFKRKERCPCPGEDKKTRTCVQAGEDKIGGFSEFSPPCFIKKECPKPWRFNSVFGIDPCDLPLPRTKCQKTLGRHTILNENDIYNDIYR